MDRNAWAILTATLLTFAGAALWVPVRGNGMWYAGRHSGGDLDDTWTGWDWIWVPLGGRGEANLLVDKPGSGKWPVSAHWEWEHDPWTPVNTRWPLLIGEHAVLLLLGGGLLTWAVRRQRTRSPTR
jgi:hypothetical protein